MNKRTDFGKTITEVIDVRRNKISTFLREKAFLLLLLMSILAVGGIVAVDVAKEKEDTAPKLLAELATQESQEPETVSAQTETTTEREAETTQVARNEVYPGDAVLAEGETEAVDLASNLMDATDEPKTEENDSTLEETAAKAVDAEAGNIFFYEDSTLAWPVEGNVILDFSMDSTVYFATLGQYKYNPAILIQSEVNTPVFAATDGIVSEISSDEEIGNYVVMELGNDYCLQYGQLKALEVSEGQLVKAGELIGYISEPSKYYVTEGSHLYLKMMSGEKAVDPLTYIR